MLAWFCWCFGLWDSSVDRGERWPIAVTFRLAVWKQAFKGLVLLLMSKALSRTCFLLGTPLVALGMVALLVAATFCCDCYNDSTIDG
jgi:hypothetical protein